MIHGRKHDRKHKRDYRIPENVEFKTLRNSDIEGMIFIVYSNGGYTLGSFHPDVFRYKLHEEIWHKAVLMVERDKISFLNALKNAINHKNLIPIVVNHDLHENFANEENKDV